MILVDTDILSALAKIGRIHLLFALLQTLQIHITPGVFGELAHSFNLRRQYAVDVLALIVAGQLQIMYLTQEEPHFGILYQRPWAQGSERALPSPEHGAV